MQNFSEWKSMQTFWVLETNTACWQNSLVIWAHTVRSKASLVMWRIMNLICLNCSYIFGCLASCYFLLIMWQINIIFHCKLAAICLNCLRFLFLSCGILFYPWLVEIIWLKLVIDTCISNVSHVAMFPQNIFIIYTRPHGIVAGNLFDDHIWSRCISWLVTKTWRIANLNSLTVILCSHAGTMVL